eukprot:3796691-Amphidinium_carterae.1
MSRTCYPHPPHPDPIPNDTQSMKVFLASLLPPSMVASPTDNKTTIKSIEVWRSELTKTAGLTHNRLASARMG